MPRANKGISRQQQGELNQDTTRRQQPGAQDAGREADALDKDGNVDQAKLRENQERLRVDPEHKTPAMRKGRRGTFP
jgi:hypothetical protein